MNIAIPKLVGPDGLSLSKPEYPAEFAIPNIEVVGPRLLVLPARNVEYQTKGGIVVPEHAQERHSKGIVLLLGDGVMLEDGTKLKPRVEAGQEIIYARYAGVELTLQDTEYLIIQESDVRVILSYRGNILTQLRQTDGDNLES